MNKRVFVLTHDLARQRCATFAKEEAADGMLVTFQQAPKSRIQEEKYHAMFGDIARQYTHAGRKWDADDMKRLLVDAFKRETKDDPEFAELWKEMGELSLAPAIGSDGFVALGTQTKKLPRKLATALIEWLYAFGAENGIRWTEPKERLAA
jgi:hypothetical protein